MSKENSRLILSEGYSLRFEEASNLLLYIYESTESKHTRASLAHNVGISERMVKCLTNYCKATGILLPGGFKISPLGKLIAKFDPYFSDVGTLWIMHYSAAANKKLIIWNEIFNKIIYQAPQPTPLGEFVKHFKFLEGSVSENTIRKNIPSEVGSILNAYTEQQFSKLGILNQFESFYSISRNQPLNEIVFLALIMAYQEQYYKGATTLDFDFISQDENSPGKICLLTQPNIREKLENLHRQKFIQLETRADLDQIRFVHNYSFLEIIDLYYRRIYE